MQPAPKRLPHLLAIDVGNSRTRFGLFKGKDLNEPRSMENADIDALAIAAKEACQAAPGVILAIASVNDKVADALDAKLSKMVGEHVYRFGRDLDIPIVNTLEDDSTVGQDRLLCALGASIRAEQACVVIDAGTAITVDFVDGEGVFQGGVIAPGVRMMIRAMHEQTAALPSVELKVPGKDRGPFGKHTKEAMTLGVINAARGLVRETVERFAEAYEAYPQIIATGGDAALLFEDSDLVENIVPDLQLVGIAEACAVVLQSDSATDLRTLRKPQADDVDEHE